METINLAIPLPYLPTEYPKKIRDIFKGFKHDLTEEQIIGVTNILFLVYNVLYDEVVRDLDYNSLKMNIRRNKDFFLQLFSTVYPNDNNFKLTYWLSEDTGMIQTPSETVRINRHNKHF